ncbi:unnamed protein product [Hymenolepis diminuta]|uniref:Uncharacterized protein n=2 Tax=Hymenolepis diminuta TaxID=6216 RepID=A0A0R3SW21_HYMDI|nr:unnamed protein product [Hymenolepis diminuta]
MLSPSVRFLPINRSLPPIPDEGITPPTTIRRRVPRMGTCVTLRPPASSTASSSISPRQSQISVPEIESEKRNSCEIAAKSSRIVEDDEYEFRASSAPSEHSYAEYLTTPLRPLTQRRSPSPENPRRQVSRLQKGSRLTHHSRRSRSSNTVTVIKSATHDIINGMYRLKLKRSNEASFPNEFLGNKSLIRKYRQRHGGQKRYTSKEDQNLTYADPEYDTVETSGDEGVKKENQAPASKPPAEVKPSSPVFTGHHTTRSAQRRNGKHHQQSSYDSPCRLVTMLVI